MGRWKRRISSLRPTCLWRLCLNEKATWGCSWDRFPPCLRCAGPCQAQYCKTKPRNIFAVCLCCVNIHQISGEGLCEYLEISVVYSDIINSLLSGCFVCRGGWVLVFLVLVFVFFCCCLWVSYSSHWPWTCYVPQQESLPMGGLKLWINSSWEVYHCYSLG